MGDKEIKDEGNKTFDEVIKIEPGLRILKNEAIQYMHNPPGEDWKRSRFWYRQLKPRFIQLVGFLAMNPELQTTEAYDMVYMGFIGILKI